MPPKEELAQKYDELRTFLALGKFYGVSNVTAKNWCKYYGIEKIPHKDIQRERSKTKADLPEQKVIEQYLNGTSIQILAKMYGVSQQPIRKLLMRNKIPMRSLKECAQLIAPSRKKHTPEVELQMIEKYHEGQSNRQIGEEYDMSSTGVQKRLKGKINLRTRSESGKIAIENGKTTCMERYGSPYPPNKTFSTGEIELIEWANSLGMDFVRDNKLLSGWELDGFDSKRELAIEFNGIWFHCEEFKDKNYHAAKTAACERQGVRLFHIWEDEWNGRKDQVKSFLKASFGIYETRLYARKMEIREIDIDQAKGFLEQYHIQGGRTNITFAVGIFQSEDLLGVMAFGGNPNGPSTNTFLNRLCFKDGIQIVGGASRLFQYAWKQLGVPSITTWSDNRLSRGDIYEQMGFRLVDDTPPDYSYLIKSERIRVPKSAARKSKTGCPPEMSEHEWCKANGWYRIYDCGKKKWVYDGQKETPE